MLRFLGLLVGIVMVFWGVAQDQSIADSLKAVYADIEIDDTIRFKLLNDISFNETNPDEAIKYADLLIEEARKDSIVRWLYTGYFQKGNALRLKADFQEAFNCYFKSLEYAQLIGYKKGVGASYISIADTYSSMDNSNDAMEYYNRGIKVLRQFDDSVKLATALLNAGDEFFNAGKLDSAINYFEESGEIFNLIDYRIGQAYNLGNVGLVYAEKGQHDLAEDRIREATIILEKLGDYYPISVYNFFLADIYLEKNDIDRALRYAHAGYNIGLDVGLKEQIKDGALKLSELYEAADKPDNAYKYLRQHLAYRDSINSNRVVQQMADLQREYEVRQKQIEIDLANQEKRNQQIISVALIIILSLSGVLLITLYRNNQERKKVNRKLSDLNETKDKFFSIISHDLRGPVSSFYGISRIIKMYLKRKDYEGLNEITGQIDHSVKTLGDLLDNLLNWAIQQKGQLPYVPEVIEVKELFNYVTDVFKDAAKAKNISVEIHLSENHIIHADRNTTQTILRNLVSNAIKFTPEGGTITLNALKNDPQVAIQVSDTGIGIPEDKLESLFSFNAKKSTFGTAGEKGLGLGLQLVYEFVSLNKGEIEVDSQVGKGTTFTVQLPRSHI